MPFSVNFARTSRCVYQEAILNAAEKVLMQTRRHAAKVSEIAEIAGISVGTVYYYFKDKEAIFAALSARQHNQLFAALEEPYLSKDPIAQLEAFTHRTLLWFEKNRCDTR